MAKLTATSTGNRDSADQLAERLRKHVDVLANLIGPRHLEKASALAAAAGYVEQQFQALQDVVEHETYSVGDQQATNLVVERTGSTQPEQIVLLGAHYDTVPGTPGADDNASAVAVLIETARLLQGRRGRRTIRFVAFTCEEPPHFYQQTMGSQIHARRCCERREQLVGMLCLEMVGFYRDEPGSQQLPPGIPRWLHWLFPKRGNFLAAIGNPRSWRLNLAFRRGFKSGSRFPLFSMCLPEAIHEIRRSDHAQFWDQGYQALMLTDTSFLRNPNYHLATDTADTLDYARMAEVTLGVAAGVARLAAV